MLVGQLPTLHLPQIFSDGMVLQRNAPIPIFGSAKPGTRVVVQLASERKATYAGKDGRWILRLNAHSAGGPYDLTVKTSAQQLNFHDLLIGEVWLASGQSNMELRLDAAAGGVQEMDLPDKELRMFTVGRLSTDRPQEDVKGEWQSASKRTSGRFSAVGYFFGKELHKRLNVPVGIIHASWGGTPAQAWTSLPALSGEPKLRHYVDTYFESMKTYSARRAAYEVAYADWQSKTTVSDPINRGERDGWAMPNYDASDWSLCTLPNMFNSTVGSEVIGSVWFRRSITLPESADGQAAKLELGPVDDFDVTYVNGIKVGHTGNETPECWLVPRVYNVPAGVLQKGVNTVAIRVFNQAGSGGLSGAPSALKLIVGSSSVSLAGDWRAKVEQTVPAPPADIFNKIPQQPFGPGHPSAPGNLFNGMIAPLIPYGVKGAIWYQGESNVERAFEYRTMLPTLIQDWRERWSEGPFPFYYVQLPNYLARHSDPGESDWAEMREAQSLSLGMPNTGQAVTIDIGEERDIHPTNKRDVGKRLARIALAKNYGWNLEYSGPVLDRVTFNGDHGRVYFSHADGLRTSDGDIPTGFQIAGDDRKWVWASARIEGSSIVVSSAKVPKPVAIRYAWADNPACNVVNLDGLPASPFRTDDWPGITVNK